MAPRGRVRFDQIDVLVHVPSMELKNELAAAGEHLVFAAAVRAFAPEKCLIPPAARRNVANGDQRLGLDSHSARHVRTGPS